MKLSEKFKAIRIAEGLSQAKFCEIIGLSLNTLRKYEIGLYEPSGFNLVKVTKHPRFKKYTMWLMIDEVKPEVGQIEPTLSINGSKASERKTNTKSYRMKVHGC